MYLNQIDQLIDILLNSYYFYIIDKNIIQYIKTSINKKNNLFVENFEKINNLILSFINNQNINKLFISNIDNEIHNVIKDVKLGDENNNKIIVIIINYLYNYILLLLGYYINDEIEYINILLELSKKYDNNLLTPEIIPELKNYHKKIIIMKYIVENYNKKEELINNELYTDIIIKLNNIYTIFKNEDLKPHNIVKYILFNDKYIKKEKKEIYDIIEKSKLLNMEYKYIEVIESLYEKIDFNNIEQLLKNDNYTTDNIEEIYDLVIKTENIKNKIINKDDILNEKVNYIFKKKILIPITEDFLRYHKDTEKYDKEDESSTKINIKEKNNKKDNTKIRYIVTKMNKMKELYNEKLNKREDISKIYYQPLQRRNIVLINDIEETNIIRKLNLQLENVIINNDYYFDLVRLRQYPYINFKHLSKDGFILNIEDNIESIRYTNILYPENKDNNIEWRMLQKDNKANIIGVVIPNYFNTDIDIKYEILKQIQCNKNNNLVNINIFHNNGLKITLHKLNNNIINNKINKSMMYWLFDKKKDIITDENINLIDTNYYYMYMISLIYDNLVIMTYNKIMNILENIRDIGIVKLIKLIKNIENKLI